MANFKAGSSYKNLKFTLQIYLTNGNLADLFSCLNKCKGFVQADITKNSYLGNDLFDNPVVLNCLFELKNKVKINAFEIVLTTLKFVLSQSLFSCAIYLFNKSKSSHLVNSNLSAICQEIEFGNLSKPGEFLNPMLTITTNCARK